MLQADAETRLEAAKAQRAVVEQLAANDAAQAQAQAAAASAEARRARLATEDQERVARRSTIYAALLALLAVSLAIPVHVLRTRQLRFDAAQDAASRAELVHALSRLDARLDQQQQLLLALPRTPARRWWPW